MQGRFKYWLAALLWMGLIFYGSTGTLSSANTSRFLAPFLHWLAPGFSDAEVRGVQFAVRKSGHLFEYGVLAGLLWLALRRQLQGDRRGWEWRTAGWTLALAVLYAITDETHQAIRPDRHGSAWDVLIDACGAAAALGLIRLRYRWRHRP